VVRLWGIIATDQICARDLEEQCPAPYGEQWSRRKLMIRFWRLAERWPISTRRQT